jgi:hypothetical protein
MSSKLGRVGLVMLVTIALLGVLAARAQDVDFPPWPIIYDGTVEVDGELLSSGMLTAHIGDWTSSAVPVVGGRFACGNPCLIVGPPTLAYVGSEVTFRLAGVERPSLLTFDFPQLGEPDRRAVTLEFSTGSGVSLWVTGLIGLTAVALGGGVVALMFRRGASG